MHTSPTTPGSVESVRCLPGLSNEWIDRDIDARHRATNAHTVARPGGFDLCEADVGDRQHLGHAIRGVRLGPGEEFSGGSQHRGGHRGPGRHQEADTFERGCVVRRHVSGGSDDVPERGGRGKEERCIDRTDRCGQRVRREAAR